MDNQTETRATSPQEVRVPPTFKAAREAVIQLAEQNNYAKGLIGMLARKRVNMWTEALMPVSIAEKIDEKMVGELVSWLTHSSDFASLDEVKDFIEKSLRETVDGNAQRLIQTPDGRVVGVLSTEYRQAGDQLFAAIQPFVEKFKKKPINKELSYWETNQLASGGIVLQARVELETRYKYQNIAMGNLVFYCPDQLTFDQLQPLQRLAREMDQVLGNRLVVRKRMHIMLVPESKFCPRGGAADPTGNRLIVDLSHDDRYRIFAHEYVHAYLGQFAGASKVATVSEGAALFFARKRFPQDRRNDYRFMYGWTDVQNLISQHLLVGLSHTQMLENIGKKGQDQIPDYEYAYRFGGFLTEYIINTYGLDKYFELYKSTCFDNFFDNQTGKQLIKNGIAVASQREIMTQVLRRIGFNPDQIAEDFDVHLKQRTLNPNG